VLIVGELINASRQAIAKMIEDRDVDAVVRIAKDQLENGAAYLDVNAGIFMEKETEYLSWLVTTIQDAMDAPCCIDSPKPGAIEAALAIHKGTAMINSISLEKDRWDNLLPVIAGSGCKIVALCMSDEGMPKTADQRLAVADRLINGLTQNNVPVEDVYVDPLVQPVATDHNAGAEFLEALSRLTREFPGVHTMCGLSNISFGLPKRALLNQAFMIMAIANGLDGAIVNPLDKRMMAGIIAAENLIGKDTYSAKYLKAYRDGKLA
jgi:5-methyltetrahydrofolate--homocysteine methyltransferase